jgi:hypothetical protein
VPFLLRNNTPPQHVKDICAALLVHRYGGSFADLKLFWLGSRRLSLAEGGDVLIATEPVKIVGRRTTHRMRFYTHFHGEQAAAQIWLAFFRGKPRCGYLWTVHRESYAFWLDRAHKIQAGALAPNDWSKMQGLWMKNTQIWHDALDASVRLLPPRVLAPLPAWIVSVNRCGTSAHNFGYYIPTPEDIWHDPSVMAVTLWTPRLRNWSPLLRASAHEAFLGDRGLGPEICADARRFAWRRKIYRCLRAVWHPYLLTCCAEKWWQDVCAVVHAIAEVCTSDDLKRWWDLRSSEDEEEVRAYTFALVWFSLQMVLQGDEAWIPFHSLTEAESRRAQFLFQALLPCAFCTECARGIWL